MTPPDFPKTYLLLKLPKWEADSARRMVLFLPDNNFSFEIPDRKERAVPVLKCLVEYKEDNQDRVRNAPGYPN